MSARKGIILVCDICGTALPFDAPTHSGARKKAKELKWSGSIGAHGVFTDFCDMCCHYNREHFLEWCETPDGQRKTDAFIKKVLRARK